MSTFEVILDESYLTLIVKGHSNFSLKGKDIVCAGISSIIYGGINALISTQLEKYFTYKIIEEPVNVTIKVDITNIKVKTILETMIIQLQTIADSFKNNLKQITKEKKV
jgi:uncharacterized protein YsxB (DUF464 family)